MSSATGQNNNGRPDAAASGECLLVVQDTFTQRQHNGLRRAWSDVWFVSFDALEARLSHPPSPDIVMSRVIGRRHDALEVAAILNAADFSGVLWCVGHNITHPDVIRSEITAQFPDIAFEILEIGDDGSVTPV